jgi:hypothetical protein
MIEKPEIVQAFDKCGIALLPNFFTLSIHALRLPAHCPPLALVSFP